MTALKPCPCYFGEKIGLEESWQTRQGHSPGSAEYALWELVEAIDARNSKKGYADYLGTARAYENAMKKAKEVLT